MNCLVCEEKDVIVGKEYCAECWKFYERAGQKFNQVNSRKIAVEFENKVELAQYLKKIFEETNRKCHYSGVKMVAEEFGKAAHLEQEHLSDPENKKKKKAYDEYTLSLKTRPFSVDRKLSVNEDGKGKAPYKRGNIVLCTTPINLLKGSLSHEKLLDTCFNILQNEVDSYRKDSNRILGKAREFVEKNESKAVYPTDALLEKEEGIYEQETLKKKKGTAKKGNGKKPKKKKKKRK